MNFPYSFWTVSQNPNTANYQNNGYQGGSIVVNKQNGYFGLLAYYEFLNSSNLGIDSSINSNNLTTVGSPAQAAGIVNKALSSPNSSSYLNTASNVFTNLGAGNSFTVAGWFYASAYSAFTIISNTDWNIEVNSTNFYFNFGGNSAGASLSSYSTNTWLFFAVSFDGINQLFASINGSVDTSTSTTSAGTSGTTTFGFNVLSIATLRLAEIGIWNRKLSSADLTALYNGGAGLGYSSLGSLP